MGNERPDAVETDIPGLLKEALEDAETLAGQQLELLRREVVDGIQDVKEAALATAGSAGLFVAAGLMGTHMLVHGMHRGTKLPLWACFGIVAGLLGAGGAVALGRAKNKMPGLSRPWLQETERGLRENTEWLKKQVTT